MLQRPPPGLHVLLSLMGGRVLDKLLQDVLGPHTELEVRHGSRALLATRFCLFVLHRHDAALRPGSITQLTVLHAALCV